MKHGWVRIACAAVAVAGLLITAWPASAGPSNLVTEAGTVSSTDFASGGMSFDVYRYRISMTGLQGESYPYGYYGVGVRSSASIQLCTFPGPLTTTNPLSGRCTTSSPDFSGTSFWTHQAFGDPAFEGYAATGPVPGSDCISIVIAAPTTTTPVTYTLGIDPSIDLGYVVSPIGGGDTCPPQATSLVADPAILEIGGPSGLGLPLGKLTAHLTAGAQAVPGRQIQFTTPTGTLLCAATTDATGTASCSNLLGSLLALGYRASFTGDGSFAPSSAQGSLIAIGGSPLL